MIVALSQPKDTHKSLMFQTNKQMENKYVQLNNAGFLNLSIISKNNRIVTMINALGKVR